MISFLLLCLALGFMVIGMPVAFAIGVSSLVYFLLPSTFMPDTTAVQRIVAASQSFPLLAVPLFILVLFFQRQIVSGLTAGAVKG